ncbi:MAG: hypothetical protein ACOX9C_11905 [Kiritimatiellia bacterium]
MFWPVVLPFKITFYILGAVVVVLTLFSAMRKKKWRKTFFVATALSCLAFIPSCRFMQTCVDQHRFGVFEYESFDEVDDFRVERYLPRAARDIVVNKYGSGHEAKYKIAEEDLRAFVDDLWNRHGHLSSFSRKDLEENACRISGDQIRIFGKLNWPVLDDAIRLSAPVAGNGAGCEYFYSRSAQTAYHRAGYW